MGFALENFSYKLGVFMLKFNTTTSFLLLFYHEVQPQGNLNDLFVAAEAEGR